ncbi:MAG: NAD(P)-binding domain-containing protein [Candidatus Nanopelagicales bacterium]
MYSVAVVGTGRIGMALATAFASAGLEVVIGSRTPQAVAAGALPVVSLPQALDVADAVVLAVPGSAVGALLEEYRPRLQSAAVIDATNSVGSGRMHHAADAVGLSYYRAFNTLGVENFEQPTFGEEPADLFYSGPPTHKDMVEALIAAVGLRPVYVGDGPASADLLDGITRLWFALVLQQGHGRHLALRMLT